MPETTAAGRGEDIPQLTPPNLTGYGKDADGTDTYRDADFEPGSQWSYPFSEGNGYIHIARFVNEFRVERAPGRDLRSRVRTVHHEDTLVTELGGGRCRTEVRVTYEDRVELGWLLLMKYELWTTDVTLRNYLEGASGKELTAVSTAGDSAVLGAGLSSSAAGTAAAPLALAVATGLSTFVATSGVMSWLKEDNIRKRYETGWKVLGWYTTRSEPVPGSKVIEDWEPIGEHPCGRPITGSPAPPRNAVWGGTMDLPGSSADPPAVAAPVAPPDGEHEIEFDPTRPDEVPFDLPHIDRTSLDPVVDGAYTDPSHGEGRRWVRLLQRDGDSWIIVVFDNLFVAVRDELYDDEDVVFVRTGRCVDHAIGDGLCEQRELVTQRTERADGYRLDMSYRVLRVTERYVVETTGLAADALVPTLSAMNSWAEIADKIASTDRVSGRVADLFGGLGIGRVTPFIGIGLSLVSLYSEEEDDDVEVIATGWAPVGFFREPVETLADSYLEEWVTVGPPHPCDPRLRLGYVPDWLPPGSELPEIDVPDEPDVPVEPLPGPGSIVIEPEIELPGGEIERPVVAPVVDAIVDRAYSGRGVERDEITHVITEEDPPPDVLAAQLAAERQISLVTGFELIGRSTLVSWTDSIGPGRESRGYRLVFPLNAGGRPLLDEAFPIFQRAGWLDVRIQPEEPFEPRPDGTVDRVFNVWAFVHDGANGRLLFGREATWEETPYTGLRHVFEPFWEQDWYTRFKVNRYRDHTRPTAEIDDRVADEPASDVVPTATGIPDGAPWGGPGCWTRLAVSMLALLLMVGGVVLVAQLLGGDDDSNGDQVAVQGEALADADAGELADDASDSADGVGPDSDGDPAADESEPVSDEDVAAIPDVDPVAPEPRDWNTGLRALGARNPMPAAIVPIVDPRGGISFSIVSADGRVLPSTSIDEVIAFIALFPFDAITQVARNTSYPCGAVTDKYRVTCPVGAADLDAGEYIVVAVEHDGPVAEGEAAFTYGLAFDDDGDDSDNYQFVAPFDADFFRNTEHWYRLQIDQDGTRTMWADGVRDGVNGYPRPSSAFVIERGTSLIWVIPRTELPGPQPRLRATAFHDTGPDGEIPNPATSGGDVTGGGVTEELIPVPPDPVPFDDLAALPPDTDGTTERLSTEGDPDDRLRHALVAEFAERANAAFASEDPAAVDALLLPGQLGGGKAADCRATVDSTIALADGMEVVSADEPPLVSPPVVLFSAVARLRYPTGTVDWGPLLTPGAFGRLYLVLPSCI